MSTDTASSYGGVIVSGGGCVLLREPAGHYGGYVWTFAKGRPDPGETPEATALREVLEETGYAATILAPIPGTFGGTTGSSRFWLMDGAHPPVPFHHETSRVRWATFEQARKLIAKTKTSVGCQRDLAILDAAEKALRQIPYRSHPSVQPEDWFKVRKMPVRTRRFDLDLVFDAAGMSAIRRGFIPTTDQQRWFMYFTGTRLRLHRSWTGILVYDIGFEPTPDGGWRAFEVVINNDKRQYFMADEKFALDLIANLIENFLVHGPEEPEVDGFVAGLLLATQPKYLGSPSVVSELVSRLFDAMVRQRIGKAAYADIRRAEDEIVAAFTDEAAGYTRMPGWHSEAQLGEAFIKYMGLDPEYHGGESLAYILSEGLCGLQRKIREMLNGFQADPIATWDPHGLAQLNDLHRFVTTVLLGTNVLEFGEKTLDDFAWRNVDAAPSEAGAT